MASNLQIQKPYVLKALSSSVDRPDGPGRHIVGEVYGQKHGSKRRKRSELSVAIDGDSVHLYDIPSQQAITSYLVSPQSFFTCAAYSLRCRSSTSKTASRFTYVSTQDSLSSKKEVKLFKDVLAESGSTTSTTASHVHRCDKPIIHLTATSSRASTSLLGNEDLPVHDIVAVAADGTILGLNGETMEKKWQSSPSLLSQELSSAPSTKILVDFVQATSAADVIDGMFGGENDLFGVFNEEVHRDRFNPDVFLVITSPQDSQHPRQRYLHILALSGATEAEQTRKQNIISVFAAPLSTTLDGTKIQLDAKSGTLQELSKGILHTYSFKSGIPHLENKLDVPDMTSFLRLSKTSVLAATPTSLAIYNPIYRSLQASTLLEAVEETREVPASDKHVTCELVTYLASREIAVGLLGNSLIAVQIEAPKGRNNKRRAEGLLTDAIRRGLSREGLCEKRSRADHAAPVILSGCLPGSMSDDYWVRWHSEVAKADELLQKNNRRAFETLLAETFKVGIKEKQAMTNGVHPENTDSEANGTSVASDLPEWKWPSSRADYPHVDRRWVFYAISKMFAWNSSNDDAGAPRLTCRCLPESNVLNYLVDAGHLTTSNIKSAFKDEICDLEEVDSILGEELPPLLVQVDPTMELLLSYLSGTQLGPTELVSAIKLILRSLDLFEDPSKLLEARVTEDIAQQLEGDNEVISMELDRAEEELQVTEYYLGADSADSSRRGHGLSVAFDKLAKCPANTTVRCLRRLLKPEETMCLMSVLRMELIKDGWTTRYLDRSHTDEDELEGPPDGSIVIIADLLCRCIDSIGLGGWMTFDTMLANWGNPQDSVDFFDQFQAEVSVALEGIHEAIRIQGTLAEAVNYAKRACRAVADAGKSKAPSFQLGAALPLGLKADSKPSLDRVRSGGEIVRRSRRQVGLFASKKRSSYSVHMISEDSLLEGGGVTTIVEEAAA
ncbi:hypothetical protein B0H66DRAFT_358148 [Apodospora peruviana]|uniref:Uncharacterized protein n=1 Tax=Apodospora peruviana TaxID=516989 RepID=A0AAE0LZU9_9PEZI|nr:hypothetical protein B0H66DRAFT_358148 [Apodospora peruviana]